MQVTINYTLSDEDKKALKENEDTWQDDLETAVELSLHGRYGYTGRISFDWRLA